MPWKKAWPTGLKDQLKRDFGLSDKNIAVLEKYSSITEFDEDPVGALKGAKKAEIKAALKQAGIW